MLEVILPLLVLLICSIFVLIPIFNNKKKLNNFDWNSDND
tara:strand:- start:1418 stop:1537 length:120 start_codon:yes stop_codon:yes gene_type:complete